MGRRLSDSGSLSIELSWARPCATRQDVVSRVAFPREFIPIFEEAARLFRERSPFEEFEIRGVVKRLDRPEGPQTLGLQPSLPRLITDLGLSR